MKRISRKALLIISLVAILAVATTITVVAKGSITQGIAQANRISRALPLLVAIFTSTVAHIISVVLYRRSNSKTMGVAVAAKANSN